MNKVQNYVKKKREKKNDERSNEFCECTDFIDN